jgi:hypothetical protein
LKSRLAKIARIAAKIAGGLIACVVLIFLALFILNSFDAQLSSQAKALLAAPANPYPRDENVYLAMAGLEGGEQRSIIEMGQERIEAYNQALDSMLLNPDSALSFNKKWDSAKLAFRGKEELGSLRTASIWTVTKTHRQDVATLLASNQQLYQRYLSLHRLQGYYETARPSFMAPFVVIPQPLRILFLADVANRIQTGTLQQQREALRDLQSDLEMWRTVLKGDGTLISKMVAVAWLHADLTLVADLITDPSSDHAHLDDLLDPMLSPADLAAYRIGNAFAAEFRGTAAFYKNITAANELVDAAASSWPKKAWNAFLAQFFKVNATENMGAAMAAQWVALGDSDPSQFYPHREAYREWLDQNEPHLSPAYLYNPVGKTLVKLAVSQNDAYSLRVFDVAAYQRLVYLAFQLKRQHIATADMAAFLKGHPEWSTHPVGGKPFQWNADTAELAVNTLGERQMAQRFSLILR